MTDTLKLYPPPNGGRWKVWTGLYRDGLFCRVSLIVREKGFFGADNEEGYELVSTRKTDIELYRKKIRTYDEGDHLAAECIDPRVLRTEDEMDKAIWEASREIVRKYNRKRRPHEYITEWENE